MALNNPGGGSFAKEDDFNLNDFGIEGEDAME